MSRPRASTLPRPPLRRMEAVLYARVSSKEQEKEGFSIPAQLKLLNTYAEDNGFRVIKEFIDVETAKQSGRTGFQEMVALFKKELSGRRATDPCRILLVEKTDRLYRNLKDYVTLEELDIEIHTVKEGAVLSRNSHSSAKFMHGIKVLMAKNYVDNLAEETRKGMSEKAAEGIWPSSAPAGYKNVPGPGGKRVIEVDPEVGPLITRLFELYATGQYALRTLSEELHQTGLMANRAGGKLSRSQLHQILNNTIYYGEFVWKGVCYQGVHKPLITKELYERCQEVMGEKGQHRSRHEKHAWAFQGLVFCGHCGSMLTAEIQKERYIYYHCTRNDRKQSCPEKYVREEVLARQLGEAIGAIRMEPEVLAWVVQALKESHADERRFHEESVARLEKQARVLRERLSALYVDKLDEKVTPEVYEQLNGRWTQELEALRSQLAHHERADRSHYEEGALLLERVQKAVGLYEQQEMKEKRRLLNFVLSNSIWKDGRLQPVYRKPFDLLVLANEEQKKKGSDPNRKSDPCSIWLPSPLRMDNRAPGPLPAPGQRAIYFRLHGLPAPPSIVSAPCRPMESAAPPGKYPAGSPQFAR